MCKNLFVKISQNSKESTHVEVPFSLNLQALSKKRPLQRYFPMNFTRSLRRPCFIEHLHCHLFKSYVESSIQRCPVSRLPPCNKSLLLFFYLLIIVAKISILHVCWSPEYVPALRSPENVL